MISVLSSARGSQLTIATATNASTAASSRTDSSLRLNSKFPKVVAAVNSVKTSTSVLVDCIALGNSGAARGSRRAVGKSLPGGFLPGLDAPLKYKLGRRRDDGPVVGRWRFPVQSDGIDDARHKGFVRAVRPHDVALVVPRRLDEPPLGVGRGPPEALPREQHHLFAGRPTQGPPPGSTQVSPFDAIPGQ